MNDRLRPSDKVSLSFVLSWFTMVLGTTCLGDFCLGEALLRPTKEKEIQKYLVYVVTTVLSIPSYRFEDDSVCRRALFLWSHLSRTNRTYQIPYLFFSHFKSQRGRRVKTQSIKDRRRRQGSRRVTVGYRVVGTKTGLSVPRLVPVEVHD